MTLNVASLVRAAGGEIVGKIRLQKTAYLLQEMGIKSDLNFEYHHYGPYSESLADQAEGEVIFGELKSTERRRIGDGVPYVIYQLEGSNVEPLQLSPKQKAALAEMQKTSATVLELAATIHWLSVYEGFGPDWRDELIARKGAKTSSGRDQAAFALLEKIGLPPAAH